MPLYKISTPLEHIKESSFKFEREIQQLTEQNLKALLHLDFIRSEFSLNGFRIDTLGFDPETKAFIIVEYKRDKIQELIQLDFNELKQLKRDSFDHYETVRDLGFKEATEMRYEHYSIINEALQVKNGNEETAWDAMT